MTLTIAIIFVTVTARWTGVDLFVFPISTLLLRFRSGLMVSSSDCGVRGPTQVRISPRTAMFITTASAICSLAHGLHPSTAVPRSLIEYQFRLG